MGQHASVDYDVVVFGPDIAVPAAMNRVELQEVRGYRGVTVRLVDMDELQLGPVKCCAQRKPPDTAEPVDADTN